MQGVTIIAKEVQEALERGFETFAYAAALREAVRDNRCPDPQAEVEEVASRLELAALARLIGEDD